MTDPAFDKQSRCLFPAHPCQTKATWPNQPSSLEAQSLLLVWLPHFGGRGWKTKENWVFCKGLGEPQGEGSCAAALLNSWGTSKCLCWEKKTKPKRAGLGFWRKSDTLEFQLWHTTKREAAPEWIQVSRRSSDGWDSTFCSTLNFQLNSQGWVSSPGSSVWGSESRLLQEQRSAVLRSAITGLQHKTFAKQDPCKAGYWGLFISRELDKEKLQWFGLRNNSFGHKHSSSC